MKRVVKKGLGEGQQWMNSPGGKIVFITAKEASTENVR